MRSAASPPRFRKTIRRARGDAKRPLATRTNAEWMRDLDDAGVPCAPVQDVGQMLAHEQIAALGLLRSLPGLSQPVIGPALSIDDNRPLARSAPPALGEATIEGLFAA